MVMIASLSDELCALMISVFCPAPPEFLFNDTNVEELL